MTGLRAWGFGHRHLAVVGHRSSGYPVSIAAADKERQDCLVEISPYGCRYDLAVMAFERQAWLDAVHHNPDGPDLKRYLSVQLNEDV